MQGQRYHSDGTALGGEFQLNTYTTGWQRSSAVAASSRGDFVVTWQSDGSAGTDTSSYSIQGQRFLPEPESTLGMAAGGALLLTLRRAREARAQRAETGLALRRKLS